MYAFYMIKNSRVKSVSTTSLTTKREPFTSRSTIANFQKYNLGYWFVLNAYSFLYKIPKLT